MVVRPFDEIFRDFVTDGVPSSGPHHPYKPDIRDSLNAIVRGAFPDNRVIKLNNANEGTANEIVVSASVDIPTAVYQVLYVLNVTQENTGPVTVSGAINRKLVTNTSQPIPAGYLKPGMAVLCIDTGSELRMLSYGDVESSVEELVRQAEAALADAEQAKDQAQNAASDAVSQGNVPIYSTLASIASLEIPAGINAIRVNGRNAVGDGEGGLYVASDNGSTADKGVSGDGRTWYRSGDVGDDRLAAPANITYLNQVETTLEFYGGDVVEMFRVSPARQFSIGAGNINFDEPFTVPANSKLNVAKSAVFVPTFKPEGSERTTPLITLSDGVVVDNFSARLEAGINTIRTLIKVGSNSQIGMCNAYSEDFNNNRTEPFDNDLVSGSIVIEGQNTHIGTIITNRFDRGWTVVNSLNVTIGKVRVLETVMGGYVHGTRHLHVMCGHTSGPVDSSVYNPYGRGVMTPGANSLLLAGCTDSSFGLAGGWSAFDMLEHGIRVGTQQAGTMVPNHRITFGDLRIIRPYGCGFKMDDGDNFNIKRVQVGSIYTEDVGNGNWFGQSNYQNWQYAGKNSPDLDNDGNKQAVAIRNSQYVQISDVVNRPERHQDSGYIGFWLQKSNFVSVGVISTEGSRTDGVVIQSGGSISPERIYLPAVRSIQNKGNGISLRADPSEATWRDVQLLNINSQNNGGYGIYATARPSGASPYTTIKSRIDGIVAGNLSGAKNIPNIISGSGNFIDDVAIIP